MALQSSGPIAISSIAAEIGVSDYSLRNLSSYAGFSAPDAMSEFYGYSAAPPPPPPSIYWDGAMVFSYTAPGTGPYNSFTCWDWVSGEIIASYNGTGSYNFDLSSDYTSWDRQIEDVATGGVTAEIYIYSGVDTSNPGADYTSIYMSPPYARTFNNINVNNYGSITYASYDYSSYTIFASFYGNGTSSYAYHMTLFDLY